MQMTKALYNADQIENCLSLSVDRQQWMEGCSSGEYSLPGNDLEDYMNGKQKKKVNEIRLPQILHIVQQRYFMGHW